MKSIIFFVKKRVLPNSVTPTFPSNISPTKGALIVIKAYFESLSQGLSAYKFCSAVGAVVFELQCLKKYEYFRPVFLPIFKHFAVCESNKSMRLYKRKNKKCELNAMFQHDRLNLKFT